MLEVSGWKLEWLESVCILAVWLLASFRPSLTSNTGNAVLSTLLRSEVATVFLLFRNCSEKEAPLFECQAKSPLVGLHLICPTPNFELFFSLLACFLTLKNLWKHAYLWYSPYSESKQAQEACHFGSFEKQTPGENEVCNRWIGEDTFFFFFFNK